MNLYVTQLNELINYLSIDNAILYGTSMGAPIAVSYSNKYPNLVLAVGLQVPLVHIESTMLSIMKVPYVGNILFHFFGISFIKNRVLEWPSGNENQSVFIEKYIEQLTLPGTEQSILSSLRNVGSKDFYPSYLNFSKLNIPVHISYANDDDEIDPASVQRVLEVTPHAESFIFSGGHGGGARIVPEIINIFTKFLAKTLN
jgi:pimeloyl-ACP methyl ester carboxylesterase